MAIDVSWLSEGMPILTFALIFVLAYAVIAKTKILGESKGINAVLSFILAVIFISFSSVRGFVANVTTWFAVLLIILFFFLLMIVFVLKEPEAFLKPLTIVFIILLAIILIAVIFYTFPSTKALLPGEIHRDSCNNYVRDYDYYEYEDCDKKDDYYKCYTNSRSYTYDKCQKEDGEYKCYDYDRDDRYDNCGDDVFEKLGNYIYKDEGKIISAFWLIVAAAIAGFFITRK